MSQKVKYILTAVLVIGATVAAMWLGSDAINVVPVEGELPDVSLTEEADTLLVAAGVTPLIVAILQLAKMAGWLPDGTTGKVLVIAQALAYLTILVGRSLGADIMGAPSQLVITTALTVVEFLITFGGAVGLFKGLRAAQVA